MAALGSIRYTVERPKTRREGACVVESERVIANGKFVGTVEQRRCRGGRMKIVTCTKKKVCTKGADLMWLFQTAGLRVGERRK